MNIINWTKHDINIYNEDKELVTSIQPSGYEARIETNVRKVSEVDGIPLFHTIASNSPYLINGNGQKSSMPKVSGDTIYVASSIFRNYYDRPDLYQPGQLIRDAKGQPIGCIGLSR